MVVLPLEMSSEIPPVHLEMPRGVEMAEKRLLRLLSGLFSLPPASVLSEGASGTEIPCITCMPEGSASNGAGGSSPCSPGGTELAMDMALDWGC